MSVPADGKSRGFPSPPCLIRTQYAAVGVAARAGLPDVLAAPDATAAPGW
ncbi:MAG: hypothetical protein U0Q21_11230 [Dermatophilaceae bacterium]